MTRPGPPYQMLLREERAPGVVVVTLNRPDRYNAMTAVMFDELEQLALSLDEEDVLRVVILTGAGKAFCAGYDLADAAELPRLGALGMLDLQERAARAARGALAASPGDRRGERPRRRRWVRPGPGRGHQDRGARGEI